MKLRFKNLSLLLFFMCVGILNAQDIRSNVNDILTNWLLPVFGAFLIIAVVAGIIRNFDLIEDKNNEGTRIRGFANVGMLVLYVLIASLVIGAIITTIASINISI